MKLTVFFLLMALPFAVAATPGAALDFQTPSVEIEGEPAIVNSTAVFVVAAVFSEVVSGFIDTDVSVSNAAITDFNSVDGITYSIEITPSGAGDISIDIAAGVAENDGLIGNSAALQVNIAFDATAPTVAFDNVPVTVSSLAPFDIAVEFNEPVNGFIDIDISIDNAAVSGFTPLDDASYSVQITPDGGGNISIDIAAGVAQDAAMNGNSAATQVLIDFDTIAPIADAGPDQVVNEGETAVMLDGSGSSDEPPGMVVGYTWTQIAGPAVTLINANTAMPEFAAPFVISDVVLRFDLVVTDDFDGPSSVDTVAITVTNVLAVDAGVDQQITEGDSVRLNGLNSLAINGRIADYLWTQTEGPEVVLNNASSAAPTFTAPLVDATTLLVFELIVSNVSGARDYATSFINVRDEQLTAKAPPLEVELASNTVSSEAIYRFDLTADSFGLNAVEWYQVNGLEVMLNDAASVLPSFVAPSVTMDGSIGFEVRATDSAGLVVRAGVNVNIQQPLSTNIAPDADAGIDQLVSESETVFLDARNSSDADGSIVRFYWQQTAGPAVLLSSITSARPSFVSPPIAAADSGIKLHFEVVVIDDAGFVDRDSVTVAIVDNGIIGLADDLATIVSITGDVISIQTSDGSNLVTLEASDPSLIVEQVNRPGFFTYGLIDFGVRVVPGSRVRVSFILPSPAPADLTWWKYSNARGWLEYGAGFNAIRDVVTISITDNARGDDDPTLGIIRDPGGLGPASSMQDTDNPNTAIGNSSGGSGGGSAGPYLLLLLFLRVIAAVSHCRGKK